MDSGSNTKPSSRSLPSSAASDALQKSAQYCRTASRPAGSPADGRSTSESPASPDARNSRATRRRPSRPRRSRPRLQSVLSWSCPVACSGTIGKTIPRRNLGETSTRRLTHRITRISPCLRVIRSRSRSSSSGIACFRVSPVIVLNAATSIVFPRIAPSFALSSRSASA